MSASKLIQVRFDDKMVLNRRGMRLVGGCTKSGMGDNEHLAKANNQIVIVLRAIDRDMDGQRVLSIEWHFERRSSSEVGWDEQQRVGLNIDCKPRSLSDSG